MWRSEFEYLQRLTSPNKKEHWGARQRRIRAERQAMRVAWIAAGKPIPPRLPCRILFTRIAVREMDVSNLWAALKGPQDELALCLGFSNDYAEGLEWLDPRQEKPETKGISFFALRVTLECDDG